MVEPHTGVDWNPYIAVALGAAALVGVAVAPHKLWRVGFGVGGVLIFAADGVYAATRLGVGIGTAITVACGVLAVIGAFAWRPTSRFLRANDSVSPVLAGDIREKTIPAATAGILLQFPLLNLDGHMPFDAADRFMAELRVRGPNDFGLMPHPPAEAIYQARLPEGYELPDGTRLARPTFYWMMSARTTAKTFPEPGIYEIAGALNWTTSGKSMEISRGIHVHVGPRLTKAEHAQLAALNADLKRRALDMRRRLEDLTLPLKGNHQIQSVMTANDPAARALLHGWEAVIEEEHRKAGVKFRRLWDELELLLDEFRDTFQIKGRNEIRRLAKRGWPDYDDIDKIVDLFFHMILELDNG